MVLAPCGVAIYSKLGSSSENSVEVPEATAYAQALLPLAPPTELSLGREQVVQPVAALSTSAEVSLPPEPVVSLREIAERAAREAIQAQSAAAQAYVAALQEASREASKRAASAALLAEAAERELFRASQASLQAEAAKAKAHAAQTSPADRDYLPHDHPSLDFPRSRVPARKVA